MQEQLITFETAKLAKEKGFDFRCEKAYFETLKHALETSRDGEITFPYKPPRILKRNYGDEFTIFIAEAPTQSLLQKWLREKHEIYVSPRESYSFDNTLEYVCTVNGTYVNHNIKDKPINRFDTYEQALEVGLQEGLKLIK